MEKITSVLKQIRFRQVKLALLTAGSIAGFALFGAILFTIVAVAGRSNGLEENIIMPPPPPLYENGYEENGYEPPPETVHEPEEDDDGSFLRPAARTNFLFVGVDENQLADAVMVITFYRDTGDIHMMSIPRDTHTVLPPHRLAQMREHGINPPATLKLNAVRSHGGRTNGIYFLRDQVSEMLGVRFDFYVEVEMRAFIDIVNAMGGVYITVPRRFYYRDPLATPPLVIDLPAGRNRLNGLQAEGFVRYRQLPMGDLDRNENQKIFMVELITQLMTREAIMNDPLALANIVIQDVRTNFGLLNAAGILRYIGNISGDSITSFTMPGNVGYVGSVEFFRPNTQQLPGVVNQVFFADID
jgi:LCP family protein required for cell wall assembly